jgi:hypothetical protein
LLEFNHDAATTTWNIEHRAAAVNRFRFQTQQPSAQRVRFSTGLPVAPVLSPELSLSWEAPQRDALRVFRSIPPIAPACCSFESETRIMI